MLWNRKEDPLARVHSTAEVLWEEYGEIWGKSQTGQTLKDYHRAALAKDQAALCLSGGGIRSAAFALGVLEALAKKDLLTKFHYLSTVSGGGYIGGFLSRWIYEEKGDVRVVQGVLKKAATAGEPEPAPIQWLREYSNFLTPQVGLASTDTWTAAVLWIRNTLINWFVFLPFFLVAVGFPNLYLAVLHAIPGWAEPWLLLVSLALITAATYSTCTELPSHAETPLKPNKVFGRVALPALLASFFLVAAVAPVVVKPSVSADSLGLWSNPVLPAGAVMTLGLIFGYMAAWRRTRHSGFTRNLHIWGLGAIISGAAVALGTYLVFMLDCGLLIEGAATPLSCAGRGSIYATLGPLWVVISQLLLTVFYTAFRRIPKSNAKLSPDLDREWLARLSAVKLKSSTLAAVFIGLVLIGPLLFLQHEANLRSWLLGLVGTGSGFTAVLGGKAAKSSNATPEGWKKALTFNRIVLLATLVFIALLVVFLSRAETAVANSIPSLFGYQLGGASEFVLGQAVLIAILLLLLLLTSSRINVNRFSLNAVYRNRIARAFLGAARKVDPVTGRKADPFTDFDPADNIRMRQLRYDCAKTEGAPQRALFPVINMALNIVHGDRLAWQERKASAFIVTPLASGSAALRLQDNGDALGAYVNTGGYAGNEGDTLRNPKELGKSSDQKPTNDMGITLATAMAISGAAASPSMGYNSSPATAFLMTLFNVRLGAWLPNPGFPHTVKLMSKSGPSNALRPFLSELTGRTHDKSPNVYLSDGGHFENLGIYEMIRRRCRYIVASDAGCDPSAKFEDLGNAIRKVMADIDGVAITFKELKLRSRKEQSDPPFTYAYGEIDYGDGEKGELLYVKPSYFISKPPTFENELSVDIRAYANLSDEFPHEPTGDQWFSESQFESYRRLGEILVYEVGGRKAYEASGLKEFFEDLKAGLAPAAKEPCPKDTVDPSANGQRSTPSSPAPGDNLG